MEKYTVDLDKVLDEFEFSEEQAVKQRSYRREELPATKYQKPHFQPINIADADFRPSDQTIKPNLTNLTFKNDLNKAEPKVPNIPQTVVPTEPVNNEAVEEVDEDEEECQDEEEECEDNVNNDESIDTEDIKIDEESSEESEGTGLLSVPEDTVSTQLTEITNVSLNDGVQKSVMSDMTDSNDEVSESSANSLQIDTCKINQDNVELLCDIDDLTAETKLDNKPDIVLSSCVSSQVLQEQPKEEEPQEVLVKFESPTEISDEDLKQYLQELEDLEQEENSYKLSDETVSDTVPVVDDCSVTECVKEVKVNEENERNEATSQTAEKSEDTSVELCEKPVRPGHLELNSSQTINAVSAGCTPPTKEVKEFTEQEIKTSEEESSEQEATDSVEQALEEYVGEKTENKETPDDSCGTSLSNNIETKSNELRSDSDSDDSFRIKPDVDETSQPSFMNYDETTGDSPGSDTSLTLEERQLGKVTPYWVPDSEAPTCMNCDVKFTVLRRKHHCRACGRVLCSKCCGMRAMLEYLDHHEQRVCEKCFQILARVLVYEVEQQSSQQQQVEQPVTASSRKKPNPNNPMEYCSTVPPPLQVSTSHSSQSPPTVLVPVGVLKREGSSSSKSKDTTKQVMFSDGIRPGGDLTELDGSGDRNTFVRKTGRVAKRVGTPPGSVLPSPVRMLPPVDPTTQSFILDINTPPPVGVINKGEVSYQDSWTRSQLIQRLKQPDEPPLTFAVNRNLLVAVQVVKLDCCMNKTCWVMSTMGMTCVGQDEIVVLLALLDESDDELPTQVLLQLHFIYQEAAKGNTVTEMGYWNVKESNFLDSREHGGFLFIRPTFQCLNHIALPPAPYLFGILIHRFEIPWARVFPIRLMLRLGAEMRYYPCPLVSVRFREPVYVEIGHTIINLLADFRNFSFTLANVRGLKVHMEDKQISILVPKNRYDQVVRALNNSNDPVLALASNFSLEADSHLVCIQSKGDEVSYHTHAININDKPRKVTGASFVVFNGALKSTSGLTAKTSIVEDGLMVQVPSDTMTHLRNKLKNMEDWSVSCGLVDVQQEDCEANVKIIWTEDDRNFNIGVKSLVDNMPLDGVPSIRVHSGTDYMGSTRFIRWTEVFIIKCEDGATSAKIGDPIEVNKMSESIARATCLALIKLLDMLATSGLTVIAVRATIDQENVGYEAGSNGEKLAPIYMNSLDNELIPVLHKAVSLNDSVAVLELVFHIMNQ